MRVNTLHHIDQPLASLQGDSHCGKYQVVATLPRTQSEYALMASPPVAGKVGYNSRITVATRTTTRLQET